MINGRLNNTKFANMDILKILKTLDMKKVHGHDKVSIRIIKLCCDSIYKPIELIFPPCKRVFWKRVCFPLCGKEFPSLWNIVPIYKKNEKNLVINYRPVSLLAISSRLFETPFMNFSLKTTHYLEIGQDLV